jgi:hypothetical protein
MEKVKALGIDWIPEVVDTVKKHESTAPPQDTLPESDDAWS